MARAKKKMIYRVSWESKKNNTPQDYITTDLLEALELQEEVEYMYGVSAVMRGYWEDKRTKNGERGVEYKVIEIIDVDNRERGESC